MGSIKSYWRQWLWRDATTRIITVNTIAWTVIAVGVFVLRDPAQRQWWVGLFGMPGSIFILPSRIWTAATYMVSQYDFLHLLVNMLWILLFGRVVEYFVGGGHLVGAYVVGGLAGAAGFLVACMAMGGDGILIGASCAVLGVVGLAMAYASKARVSLLLFGEVRLLWICIAGIVLFVVTAPTLTASIAHGAGLVAGVAYGLWLRRSQDIDMLQRPKPWAKTEPQRPGPAMPKAKPYRQPASAPARQSQPQPQPAPAQTAQRLRPSRSDAAPLSAAEVESQLDTLLDKVTRSGYASLSPAEKQRLFDLSQKLKGQ